MPTHWNNTPVIHAQHPNYTFIGQLQMQHMLSKQLLITKYNISRSNLGIGCDNADISRILVNMLPVHSGCLIAATGVSSVHISVTVKSHLIPSNGFSRVHECDRRHMDIQTDHAQLYLLQ